MNKLLVLLMAHFIGDFPFQIPWFVEMKGKSYEVMFYHCAVYASTVCLIGKLGLESFSLLLITHFIIDNLKARLNIIKQIWVDQLLHFIVLIGIIYYSMI